MRQCWQILAIIIRYYFIFHGLWSIGLNPYPPLPLTMSLRMFCPRSILTRHWILPMPAAGLETCFLALGWGYKKKKKKKGFYIRLTNV